MVVDEWAMIKEEFGNRFGHRLATKRSNLRGSNLMTPEWLGFVSVNGEPVEVSTGTGIYHERIFGVTWPRLPGDRPDPRSRLCTDWDDVERALMESSDDDVD